MVQRINKWAAANASGRNVVLVFVIAIASLLFMALIITPAFESATGGLRPFDLNFDINAARMYEDLPAYTDDSRMLYLAFALVDYIYPAAAAVFFIWLWAWLFAKAPHRMTSQLVSYGIFLLPLLYMLVDWSENAGFLFVIFSYPEQYPRVANITGALKATKPMIMNVMIVLTLIFVITVSARRVLAWVRNNRTRGENRAN